MSDEGPPTFLVENAQLIYRNFEGREGPFNREGDRNFSVILDAETAATLGQDGWNVKYMDAREEGEDPIPYIQITVGYKYKPPRVVLLTNDGKTRTNLDETSVGVLDWADIRTADLIARPYQWSVGDKTGIKAYLQSLFVTIEEDALERKYAVHGTEE